MVKKLFALASVTALTGFVSAATASGCTTTETVTIPADGGGGADAKTKPPGSSGTSGKPIVVDDDGGEGEGTTPTCLDKTPIDAAQIAYTKSVKAQKGACSPTEVGDLSQY